MDGIERTGMRYAKREQASLVILDEAGHELVLALKLPVHLIASFFKHPKFVTIRTYDGTRGPFLLVPVQNGELDASRCKVRFQEGADDLQEHRKFVESVTGVFVSEEHVTPRQSS